VKVRVCVAYRDWSQLKFALSQLGKVQHIIDKALHVEGAQLDGANILSLHHRQPVVFRQEAQHGQDGMQRVAQFMAGCTNQPVTGDKGESYDASDRRAGQREHSIFRTTWKEKGLD
jgi:hypothetical protein